LRNKRPDFAQYNSDGLYNRQSSWDIQIKPQKGSTYVHR